VNFKIAMFTIFFGLYIPASHSQVFPGTMFYQYCMASPNTQEYAICVSFLRGFSEGIYAGDQGAAHGVHYCGPASMDMTQILLIVQKYMREHPEDLHKAAGVNVATALWSAFPCGR
jgi:hypothetical protein